MLKIIMSQVSVSKLIFSLKASSNCLYVFGRQIYRILPGRGEQRTRTIENWRGRHSKPHANNRWSENISSTIKRTHKNENHDHPRIKDGEFPETLNIRIITVN